MKNQYLTIFIIVITMSTVSIQFQFITKVQQASVVNMLSNAIIRDLYHGLLDLPCDFLDCWCHDYQSSLVLQYFTSLLEKT